MIGDAEDRKLMEELNMISPAWHAAFQKAKAAWRPTKVVRPVAIDPDDGKVWYRMHRRTLWHKWGAYFKDAERLSPVCGMPTPIDPASRVHFKSRDELPANAELCKGCDG